jgi:hypothetical protein
MGGAVASAAVHPGTYFLISGEPVLQVAYGRLVQSLLLQSNST